MDLCHICKEVRNTTESAEIMTWPFPDKNVSEFVLCIYLLEKSEMSSELTLR